MKKGAMLAAVVLLGLAVLFVLFRLSAGPPTEPQPSAPDPARKAVKRTVFQQPRSASDPLPFRLPDAPPLAPVIPPIETSEDGTITYVNASAPPGGVQNTVWPVTKEGVRGALLEVMPEIRDCYEDALAEIPDLAGQMTVLFSIDERDGVGVVSRADLLEDDLRDEPIEECVLAAVDSLQFDPPTGGGETVVTWPFHFETRETVQP